MDLIVKRVVLDGRPMYGVCLVTERKGDAVAAWQLLHLQTGEPWAFASFYWADKKRRAVQGEGPEYLRRMGIDVPGEEVSGSELS